MQLLIKLHSFNIQMYTTLSQYEHYSHTLHILVDCGLILSVYAQLWTTTITNNCLHWKNVTSIVRRMKLEYHDTLQSHVSVVCTNLCTQLWKKKVTFRIVVDLRWTQLVVHRMKLKYHDTLLHVCSIQCTWDCPDAQIRGIS